MDRIAWLREMRRDCEAQYDTHLALLYGEGRGTDTSFAHQAFTQDFLSLLPQSSTLLDAACGAGGYELPLLLEKGHSVIGIDQSQGMLAHARARFPNVQFEKVGLQEMAYREAFDGVICMDAMKYVCPEDWPLVLGNFYRALKQGGYLYFAAETIENADENQIRQAFEKAQQAGLPVVYGERPGERPGVYHYYPTNQQVMEWTRQTGFEVLEEGNGEIYYYHMLARKVSERGKEITRDHCSQARVGSR